MMRHTLLTAGLTAALAVAALHTHAADLWWDPVPGTAGPDDGNGNWGNAANNLNWWDGAANVPWNPGDTAVFGFNTATAPTVTLTNPVVTSGIIFSNLGTAAYTIGLQGGNRTGIALAAATNLTIAGPNATVLLAAHDETQAQVVETFNAPVIAPNGLTVRADTTSTNGFVRFAHITNFIAGDLVVGTPGNATYGGNTALYVDFNTPTTTDAYASILNGATNLTIHSNAAVRISNHNSGSIATVQWPKKFTISGFGRNGLTGAWIITGNVGDNFIADVVLAGDSMIDINVGAADRVFTLFGAISGTGNLTVVSANSAVNRNRLVLTNACTFNGDLTVGGGATLQLINGDNRLPVTAALTLGMDANVPVANWNAYGRLVLGNATLPGNQTIVGLFSDSSVPLCRIVGGNASGVSYLTLNSAGSNYFRGAFGTTVAAERNLGLILNGGALVLAGSNLANGGFTVNSGTLQFGDGFADSPWAGSITNQGIVVFNPGTALTYTDAIRGAGAVVKRGFGALTLSGALEYAGSTTIESGKLSLSTPKTGTGALHVASGANLEIKRATTATAAITAASSTLNSARLDFHFNNLGLNATAPLQVAGNLANSGFTAIYIAAPGSLAVGSYPLIKYGSYTSNAFSFFNLGAPLNPRVTASIQNNSANQSIDLVITEVDFLKWTGSTDGNWDTFTPNWILSSSGLTSTYAAGDFARFDDSAPGTTSLTLMGDPQPGFMLVTNQSKHYTFGGFSGIGDGGGLIKEGAGTLTLANYFPSPMGWL